MFPFQISMFPPTTQTRPMPRTGLPGMHCRTLLGAQLGTSPLLEALSLALSRKRRMGMLMKMTSRMD